MGTYHPGLRMDYDDLVRLVMRTAVQTIQNASIGSAGIRVYDGGWIRIEGGGLFIDGRGEVSGELFVRGELGGDGTLTWTGEWKFVGNGEITGDVVISGKLKTTSDVELGGDTTIKKNLDVEAKTRLRGETTLEADLIVTSDGKILVGDMIIDPTGNGSVRFANGARVSSSGDSVSVAQGTSSVRISHDEVTLSSGGVGMGVSGAGIRFNPASVPQVTGTGLPKNVLMLEEGTGLLQRVYN